MRVATLNTAQTALSGIEARQSEQAKLQMQLSTGMRVTTPGDDPVAAAQAEMARSRITRVAQDQRSGQLAAGVLSAADGALSQGVDIMQSVRESLVAAADGGYSPADRQSLALSLRSARDAMLALANTHDGAGGYVFGGQGTSGDPMATGSNPSYGAQAGVQRIGTNGQFAATVDGRASFISLPQGNGVFTTASGAANTGSGWIDPGSVVTPGSLTGHDYAITVSGAPGSQTYSVNDLTAGSTVVTGATLLPGGSIDIDGMRVKVSGTPNAGDTFNIAPSGQQSIYQTLDDAIAALEQPATNTDYSEKLMRSQAGIDRALDSMILMRSRIGDEMNRVDSASAVSQQQDLLATERKSGLVELDYTEAISRMNTNQTGMEAALKSYANVAKLSLFSLMG